MFSTHTYAQMQESIMIQYRSEEDKRQIEQLASEVLYDYETLDMLSINISIPNLQILNDLGVYSFMEENQRYALQSQARFKIATVNSSEKNLWNLKTIDVPIAWEAGITGQGVKVAIIDSGIASHTDLKIAGGISFVGDNYQDMHGHGTHIAGIIAAQHNDFGVAGIAPNVAIYAVKAIGDDGFGDVETVVAGIDWAIKENMDIINLSFGDIEYSEALHEAIKRAKQAGIVIIAASGNEGNDQGTENTMIYPARHEEVIAVSAVGKSLQRSSFSSTGPLNDFAAPGEEIYSTFLNGQYATYQGTSLSAPHITGVLALMMEQFPFLNGDALYEGLKLYANDLGSVGYDEWYGFGMPKFQLNTQTEQLVAKNDKERQLIESHVQAFLNTPTEQKYIELTNSLKHVRDASFKAEKFKQIETAVVAASKNAEKLLKTFERSPSNMTYKNANEALAQVPKVPEKAQLEARLQEGLLSLAKPAITKLERYEKSKTKNHYTQAKFEIQRLPQSELKTALLQRLNQ